MLPAVTLTSIVPHTHTHTHAHTHTISGSELCQPMLVTVIYHHGSEDRSYDGQVAEKHENDDEDYCDDVGVGVVMIRRPDIASRS